jgi:N-acetylgalactosamine PTS system EIIA component
MSETPRAIVLAHGEMAAGLVSAAQAITGNSGVFLPLSNQGLDAAGIADQLAAAVQLGVRVVFTDLPAGSTTMAARRVQRGHPELVVVTGASLPMLLDFAFATTDAADAARAAAERGIASVMVSGGTHAN